MATRETILAKEIFKKIEALTPENLDYASDDGVLKNHVGRTDEQLIVRSKVIKEDASSFFTKEDLKRCLLDYFNDPNGMKRVVSAVLDDFGGRLGGAATEGVLFDGDPIGRVCDYETLSVDDTWAYRIVFAFKGNCNYRNRETFLPFDIITIYPVQ